MIRVLAQALAVLLQLMEVRLLTGFLVVRPVRPPLDNQIHGLSASLPQMLCGWLILTAPLIMNARLTQKNHHVHLPALLPVYPAISLLTWLLLRSLALHTCLPITLLHQGQVMICGLLCHWLLMVNSP